LFDRSEFAARRWPDLAVRLREFAMYQNRIELYLTCVFPPEMLRDCAVSPQGYAKVFRSTIGQFYMAIPRQSSLFQANLALENIIPSRSIGGKKPPLEPVFARKALRS
jgi:hypothetical protein